MDFKDYYKILGVEKTATTDEIKKAYRKMAIKFHPDNNPNNKKAEEKFKEINDANGVLSDAEQRKKFDELSEDWSKYQQSGGKKNFEGFRHANQHNGNAYQSDEGSRARGYSSGEQFNEEDFSDLFSTLFGGKQSRGRQTQPSKGQDYTTEIQITLEEAYLGITRQLDLETEKFQLTIKPGIQNKQRLRLKGKGGKGMNGAANGDLYITVNVAENQQYQRKGDDLYSSISIDLYTAILGGEAIVKTLRNPIKVPIAKETDNGKQLRMKGMGMPKYNKENEFGDLYVTISITMPKNLSEKEIKLLKELSLLNQT